MVEFLGVYIFSIYPPLCYKLFRVIEGGYFSRIILCTESVPKVLPMDTYRNACTRYDYCVGLPPNCSELFPCRKCLRLLSVVVPFATEVSFIYLLINWHLLNKLLKDLGEIFNCYFFYTHNSRQLVVIYYL